MRSPLTLALIGWAMASLLMAVLWLWHLRLRNAGIVDAGWAFALAMLAVLYAAAGPGYGPRRLLIAAMFAIWGTRLGLYLLRDRVIGRPEDGRYAVLRERWKPSADRAFFFFFEAQAVLDVLLSYPALVAAFNPEPRLTIPEFAAAGLWLIALGGESVADRQLEQFKARPESRGKTCRDGLWRFSRHPNYFFEWLIWVAYALFALPSPGGPVALLCPAFMLYLLFRVTGIPATEAQALRTKGDDYRRYQATTSVFVPWFPRSAA